MLKLSNFGGWFVLGFDLYLCRVTEQSNENKMSASNLGIIFGPTLIRPRQTDATVSLSSLVDYPYQARVVELLITFYEKIFDVSLKPLLNTSQSEETVFTVRVALSAEERDSQQPRKSFAVKEVSDFSCAAAAFPGLPSVSNAAVFQSMFLLNLCGFFCSGAPFFLSSHLLLL